jgi:hypothetical protein
MTFYSVVFGYVLYRFGIFQGFAALWAFQFIISPILVLMYDCSDKDIFGISTVKAWLKGKTARFRWKPAIIVITFIMLSWHCTPPVVIICLRKEETKGVSWRGYAILAMTITLKSIYWSFLHFNFNPFYIIHW